MFNNGWNEPYVTDAPESIDLATRTTTTSTLRSEAAANRQENLTDKGVWDDWNPSPYRCVPFNKRPTHLDSAGIYLLAGDHGITEERVSAYVPEMTAKMVIQLCRGAEPSMPYREHNQTLKC